VALLLRPGDPVPALVLKPPVSVADFAGRYLLIVCAEQVPNAVPPDVALLLVTAANDPQGTTARRMGVMQPDEFVAVLVDPAGTVVQAWAGAVPEAELRSRIR
jgi:hypothetical protein